MLTINTNKQNKLSLYRMQKERFNLIILTLQKEPTGMTISEVSGQTEIPFNTCSKYLAILHSSGKIGLKVAGNCKFYFSIKGKHKVWKDPEEE